MMWIVIILLAVFLFLCWRGTTFHVPQVSGPGTSMGEQ